MIKILVITVIAVLSLLTGCASQSTTAPDSADASVGDQIEELAADNEENAANTMSTAQEESTYTRLSDELREMEFEWIYEAMEGEDLFLELDFLSSYFEDLGYPSEALADERAAYTEWRTDHIAAETAASEDTTEESEPEQSNTKSTTSTNTSTNVNNSSDNLGAESWYGDDGTYYELGDEVKALADTFGDEFDDIGKTYTAPPPEGYSSWGEYAEAKGYKIIG